MFCFRLGALRIPRILSGVRPKRKDYYGDVRVSRKLNGLKARNTEHEQCDPEIMDNLSRMPQGRRVSRDPLSLATELGVRVIDRGRGHFRDCVTPMPGRSGMARPSGWEHCDVRGFLKRKGRSARRSEGLADPYSEQGYSQEKTKVAASRRN